MNLSKPTDPRQQSMQMVLLPPGNVRLEQTLEITPPIAYTEAELKSSRPQKDYSKFGILVREYILTEDPTRPYTDLDIRNHLSSIGQELSIQEIARVRTQLGILPSRLR